MRGETMCTVAPCSVSQRSEPRISTSSTPLVQQIAMRLPRSRPGSVAGSKRKALSSRLSSPSAVVSSSVEIDGTGEVDISCCMRWKAVACGGNAVVISSVSREWTRRRNTDWGMALRGQPRVDPAAIGAARLDHGLDELHAARAVFGGRHPAGQRVGGAILPARLDLFGHVAIELGEAFEVA